MATMNISLPDPLKEYVEHRVEEDGYSTASAFIQQLVREDQKRRAEEKLEAKLLEALDSGEASAMTRKDWYEIKGEVRRRAAQRHWGQSK